MPVLQYRCAFCGLELDELVKDHTQKVYCPECKKEAERLWSGKVYSALGKPCKSCGGNCSNCKGCRGRG